MYNIITYICNNETFLAMHLLININMYFGLLTCLYIITSSHRYQYNLLFTLMHLACLDK